jgi:hypothetical protein
MSTKRYELALLSLMLAVGFLGMGAGYLSTRRILLGVGAFAVGGILLALWAGVGKCWKPRALRAR